MSEEQAMEYVAGYVASNDVSSRKKQFETSQWGFSKGFDTACPIGGSFFLSIALDRLYLHGES